MQGPIIIKICRFVTMNGRTYICVRSLVSRVCLTVLDAMFETFWFAFRAIPMVALKIPKAAVLQPDAVTVEAIHLKFPHRWTDLTAHANWISSPGAPVLCARTLQNLIPLTPSISLHLLFQEGMCKELPLIRTVTLGHSCHLSNAWQLLFVTSVWKRSTINNGVQRSLICIICWP